MEMTTNKPSIYPKTFLSVALTVVLAFSIRADVSASFHGETPWQLLSVDEAFQLTISFDARCGALLARWDIKPGYYLYRNKFKFESESSNVKLGTPNAPDGVKKTDEFLGETLVFYNAVEIEVPVTESYGEFYVRVKYQGCADERFCYAPQSRSFAFDSDVEDSES